MNKDQIELLKNINDMYSGAFNSLITITLAIIGFIGVVLPIAISWHQNRQLKIDKENLERDLAEKIKSIKNELKEEIASEFHLIHKQQECKTDVQLKQIKKKLKRHEANATGAALHVQGNSLVRQQEYILAVISLQQSALRYTQSKNEMNLGRVISQIIECYNNSNKSIAATPHDIEQDFDRLIKRLKRINKNGGYADSITKLKAARRDCLVREPVEA